jgi:hypothetical protein
MKKVLNWLNATLDVIVWIIIMILYVLYMETLLRTELILSYLSKWIGWIIERSIKFFRRSIKSLQKFTLETIHNIIYR